MTCSQSRTCSHPNLFGLAGHCGHCGQTVTDPIKQLVDSVNRTFNRGESLSQFSDRLLRELSGDAK